MILKIAILILITFLFKVFLTLIFVKGFGVDETLYLTLAREFYLKNKFGIKTEFYDLNFVAPLWPIFLSLFFRLGKDFYLAASPLVSSLTIIPIYLLSKEIFKKEKLALLSVLFFIFNPASILLSTRVLTENIALFLYSFSLLFLFKSVKNPKFIFPFILISALSGIARYPLLLHTLVSFFVFILLTKNISILKSKYFYLGLIFSLLILSPWFYHNLINYNNILGSALHQGKTDSGFSSKALLYFPYLIIILGPAFPFVFLGLYKNLKKEKLISFLFISFFLAQFFVLGKIVEERYLFPIITFSSILLAYYFKNLNKKNFEKSEKIFFALLFLGFIIGIYLSYHFGNLPRYLETKKSIFWAMENCYSPIVSNTYTYVWYYSGFENLPLTKEILSSKDFSCIIFSEYEPYPSNIKETLKDFEEVKNFGKVRVYKR